VTTDEFLSQSEATTTFSQVGSRNGEEQKSILTHAPPEREGERGGTSTLHNERNKKEGRNLKKNKSRWLRFFWKEKLVLSGDACGLHMPAVHAFLQRILVQLLPPNILQWAKGEKKPREREIEREKVIKLPSAT
jgi:hypothetical protein